MLQSNGLYHQTTVLLRPDAQGVQNCSKVILEGQLHGRNLENEEILSNWNWISRVPNPSRTRKGEVAGKGIEV